MTQTIRHLPELSDIIIIASSASVHTREQEKSQEYGCNDFLTKPINIDVLLEKLQLYLSLEWIYEENVNPTASQKFTHQHDHCLLPQLSEIEELHQAVIKGDVTEILKEATRIKQEYPQYTDWANFLSELAQNFEIEKIQQIFINNQPQQPK